MKCHVFRFDLVEEKKTKSHCNLYIPYLLKLLIKSNHCMSQPFSQAKFY